MNSALERYHRLIRNCQTINQLNRVHIALENWMTPTRLFELHEEMKSLPVAINEAGLLNRMQIGREWINRLYLLMTKSSRLAIEPFYRKRVAKKLTLYTTGRDNKKTLAICFTGAAQRMLMPLPVFLQHLDAKSTDVALISCPKEKSYCNGVEGLGQTIEEVFDRLIYLLNIVEYDRVVAIGMSAGGLPAVMAGLSLGLVSAMGVGCNHAQDNRWLSARGEDAGVTLTRCLTSTRYVTKTSCVTSNKEQTRIYLVYGTDYLTDLDAAISIAGICTQARLINIDANDGLAHHNAVLPLLMAGKLAEFFNTTVFDN